VINRKYFLQIPGITNKTPINW